MCLLYCLGKENRHTSCKNRSAHLPPHRVRHTRCRECWGPGALAERRRLALREEGVREVEVAGDAACAGQGVLRVEQCGEPCGGIKGDWGRGGCPTKGGTDEVREKWREKKCNTSWRKGTFQLGRFLFFFFSKVGA